MPSFAIATASHRRHPDDRLLVLNTTHGWILALADGVGGASGGAQAAELFLHGVQRASARPAFAPGSATTWTDLLAELDDEIQRDPAAGETTGIALAMIGDAIIGASCGDSEAWLLGDGFRQALTGEQRKKPRLGSGRAVPQSFHAPIRGTLVMASDGLFGHAALDDVARIVLAEPGRSASALVRFLEQQYRALPDDVAIIVAEL